MPKRSVFLGGTIAHGKAPNWQAEAVKVLSELDDVLIVNPRCAQWNPEARDYEKEDQIQWGADKQTACGVRLYNFEPGFVSPVTMLELGFYGAKHDNFTVVRCPGTHKYFPHIAAVCELEDISTYETLEEALKEVKGLLALAKPRTKVARV